MTKFYCMITATALFFPIAYALTNQAVMLVS
jgi:hypothetical protein